METKEGKIKKIANDLAIRLINNPDSTDVLAILEAFRRVQELD